MNLVNVSHRGRANLDHGDIGAVRLDDGGDGSGGPRGTHIALHARRTNRTI